MNPAFYGDSYDLVKRFFCSEISSLGYTVVIDPMLTGDWSVVEGAFYRLIGVQPGKPSSTDPRRRALFLDPDTGVSRKATARHASFDRVVHETKRFELVFSFDQAFSRQAKPLTGMREKLGALTVLGCHAMYYDSHARFLFASAAAQPLHQLRAHLQSVGLPGSRLIESGT